MKRIIFLISILSFSIITNAQPYSIGFSGTGASSSVSTVKVDNLTAGTTLTVNGDDILILSSVTGINPAYDKRQTGMKIYPNPMTDNSVLQIYPPQAGLAEIVIFDMTGKMAAHTKSYLDNSIQEFSLSGVKNGLYLISIIGSDYHFSGKLLSTGKVDGTISFDKITNNQILDEKTSTLDLKGLNGTVNMQYTTGDRLMFTGISGIYSTIITDIPSSDKIITFNFIACTDGDNNNYPVVQIGTQTWMAENLKTTKFNNGTEILLCIPSDSWALPTYLDPYTLFCWYNNDILNKDAYGALYNFFTVNTGNLCPVNWHVPSGTEWATLITFVGGASVAGGILKESGISHWDNPNIEATNDNGFSALPGGSRLGYDGTFYSIGTSGYWWSSSGLSNNSIALYYRITSNNAGIISSNEDSRYGFSVRCIKD